MIDKLKRNWYLLCAKWKYRKQGYNEVCCCGAGRLENVTENLDVYWTFKDRPYLVGIFMGSNTETLFKFVYEDGVCGFTVFGEDKRYSIDEVVILRSYTLEEFYGE